MNKNQFPLSMDKGKEVDFMEHLVCRFNMCINFIVSRFGFYRGNICGTFDYESLLHMSKKFYGCKSMRNNVQGVLCRKWKEVWNMRVCGMWHSGIKMKQY